MCCSINMNAKRVKPRSCSRALVPRTRNEKPSFLRRDHFGAPPFATWYSALIVENFGTGRYWGKMGWLDLLSQLLYHFNSYICALL
jgi:hypothetical protein